MMQQPTTLSCSVQEKYPDTLPQEQMLHKCTGQICNLSSPEPRNNTGHVCIDHSMREGHCRKTVGVRLTYRNWFSWNDAHATASLRDAVFCFYRQILSSILEKHWQRLFVFRRTAYGLRFTGAACNFTADMFGHAQTD